MTDYIEYTPKRHGQRPPYWTPDTPTGLDNKNFIRQPNWAWIAGTTYYVPYEAVHGHPRPAVNKIITAQELVEHYEPLLDLHSALKKIEALQADNARLQAQNESLLKAIAAFVNQHRGSTHKGIDELDHLRTITYEAGLFDDQKIFPALQETEQ